MPFLAQAEIVTAPVVDAKAVYGSRIVNIPMEVCEQVQVEREGRNTAGTVLGAIAGAAIGNQFGKGGGKDVATVVGGVLGAQIGGQGGKAETVTEQRCRTVNRSYRERDVIEGYDITYQFMNRNYTIRTRNHPGPTIRLNVYHAVAE